MNQFDPKDLLAQSPVVAGQPGPDCPDDQTIAAALEGEYRVVQQSEFEAHVSSCQYCLGRMGRFARLKREMASEEISDLAMARAEKLIQPRKSTARTPAWAAAAMIGFAAVLATMWFAGSPDSVELTPPAPEVRNIDANAYNPRVMFPLEGSIVDPEESQFAWSVVPGTLHYDVRIVSADGSLIWQERVENAEWHLPPNLQLDEGVDYYFRVDAYLTRAKSLRSRHVMFRIEKDG
jgi:hypothetical protein